MQSHHHGPQAAGFLRLILPLAALTCATLAPAQDKPKDPCGETGTRTLCNDYRQFHSVTKTIYLTNVTQQNDANEVLVALRNILEPSIKIYLVASQNAIVLRALPDEIALAERIVSELTHPRRAYHLRFTITTTDAGKRTATQHVDIDANSGQRAVFKQGSKVPVVTASMKEGEEHTAQYTFIDVGTNLDVTALDTGKGATLKCKFESSSVGPEPAPANIPDPVIHQALIESVTEIAPGKTTLLGKTDIPGTTQQVALEVTPELIN